MKLASSILLVRLLLWASSSSVTIVHALSSSTTQTSKSASYTSLGQAISTVTTVPQGLELAERFWLPSDENLPPHYQQQLIHHETRQRWASQLLEKLTMLPSPDGSSSSSISSMIVADPRFSRLVLAAALPFKKEESSSSIPNTTRKEQGWILESLQGLLALIGRASASGSTTTESSPLESLPTETLMGIQQLIDRACCCNSSSSSSSRGYSLDQACSVLWAIQGLQARIPELIKPSEQQNDLAKRVSQLPFGIVPRGMDWKSLVVGEADTDVCDILLNEIPFSKDRIVTRQGTTVTERRGTAWIAQAGIGALAYSGKLMNPQPLPAVVSQVMNQVEKQLDLPEDFFDCALCNHYADGTAACKFHTDPEHGSHWHRTTVVVAAGSDRKFAFKPITTNWQEWEDDGNDSNIPSSSAAVTHLLAGDLVVMTDNCNDDFYHAVHAGNNNKDNNDEEQQRISLVLKRAIDRGGNGQKGHGLQGQGRRSRRKLQQQPSLGGRPNDSRKSQ